MKLNRKQKELVVITRCVETNHEHRNTTYITSWGATYYLCEGCADTLRNYHKWELEM